MLYEDMNSKQKETFAVLAINLVVPEDYPVDETDTLDVKTDEFGFVNVTKKDWEQLLNGFNVG